jgi:hypothetical protein
LSDQRSDTSDQETGWWGGEGKKDYTEVSESAEKREEEPKTQAQTPCLGHPAEIRKRRERQERGTVTQRSPFAKKMLRASRGKNTEGTEIRGREEEKKRRREIPHFVRNDGMEFSALEEERESGWRR